MTFDENQGWHTHIHGKGGLISSLNSRLFMINRLKNHLNKDALMKIIDGLFTSKLRYGLQLFGQVRRCESDPLTADLATIQKIQNKLLRSINGCRITDKICTKSLLELSNMLSVNQLNAQIKLSEMWKANFKENYPLIITKQTPGAEARTTRACTAGKLVELGNKPISQKTFVCDAIKLWNQAPICITSANSFGKAKTEIRKFVKNLPV